MLKSAFFYIFFYSKYIIQRKIESIEHFFIKYNKEAFFKKYCYSIYIIFSALKVVLEFILCLVISYVLSLYLKHFDIWILYSLYFLIITSILNGISMVKRVLSPVDKNILYLLPYSNSSLYLYTWSIKFFVHNSVNIIHSVMFGVALYIVIGNINLSVFLLLLFVLTMSSIAISYMITLYLCVFYVKCVQQGYKLSAFIISIFKGLVVFTIVYFFTKWIIYWMIKIEDIREVSSWKYLIDTFFEHINDYIESSHIREFIYNNLNQGSILTIMILLLISLTSMHYLFAGRWYREKWEVPFKEEYQDWIAFLKSFFEKLTKNPLLKVQIKNFFNNRIQLSHHYSYFFGHYFNYGLIAVATVLSTLDEIGDAPVIRFILIYIIFNSISKDAFEVITLFPGILRFDSEGQILRLYRVTNTAQTVLYQSKINCQRLLGLFEMLLIVSICLFIIHPSIQEIYFISGIIMMNFIVTPHITTLSTFMFPHLKNQHYSEMEDYVETDFVIDKLAYQFRQIIFFCIAIPFLILVFFEMNIKLIYLIIGTIFIIISILSIKVISKLINKAEHKLNNLNL